MADGTSDDRALVSNVAKAGDAVLRGIADQAAGALGATWLWQGPELKLPRNDVPQLRIDRGLSAELTAAIERWQAALRPLAEIGEQLRKRYSDMMVPLERFAEPLKRLQLVSAQCDRLEALGWLPHSNSPYSLVENEAEDLDATDRRIGAYYEDRWQEMGSALIAGIEHCDLDDEAKATFAEAVSAHGSGYYRCSPRLLFPEVERVSRKEIHGGALDKMASQPRLLEAIGSLTPGEMSSTGVAGLRFYRKLTEHLYTHMKNEVAIGSAMADPVPNRHAALHGIVSYSSAKSSLNSILVADYLLRAIATLKQVAAEEAAEDQ
jgi:hypothetical protein